MDPLSLDGQIQRASIPITGEALRCTPYDAAQSIGFGDVFQLETILGENYWHGYVKVDFLDPWDGVNPESYMAIDFIELAVNKDSLGGFGVNPEDRRFEEIRIGDIDGFGWGDGAALAAHYSAVASANDDLVNLPAKLPVNRDGFGLLASGDLLPDIDADGKVEKSATGLEPGDDWDRRSGEEVAGTSYTGRGFTRSAESFFQLGSQYTDITLSKSYTASSGEADPVLTGDLARSYGAYPAADGNSHVGSNLPGQSNNHPFYFNFYVDPFAIDPAKPLYLTLTHGDLDTSLIEVEVRDIHANSATATLMAAGTTDDGAIESSFVVLDETTLEFDDIFTWDAARNKWHGYLEVRFNNIGASTDEYFAIDFLELSTSQKNIAVPGAGSTLRVPEDFDTIQAAINVALDGSTILVAPGLYRENLDMLGKNIVLRSHDPLDPAVVATTIIDGDVDDDGTGDGAVITFRGSEDETSAVRGFTIQNGKGHYGGGIAGSGARATIEYNVIMDNSAPYGGGIAYCGGLVRHNEIYSNAAYVDTDMDENPPPEATGIGGGVYNARDLMQNDIHDNSAARGGGGVWESGTLGDANLINNLIHHNSVTDSGLAEAPGAGLHLSNRSHQAFVAHNTLVDNAWNGSMVNVIDESASAQFFNSILWDTSSPAPTAPNTDWNRLEGSDLRFNIVGGAPAKGSDPMWNMGNNPVFTNTGTLDYSLQSTSPAIDAGVEFVPPIILDFSGASRAAATADIGALELSYSAPTQGYVTISFPSVITEGSPLILNTNLSESLQELVDGGQTPSWQWQLDGNDITGATSHTLTIDPVDTDDAGDYTVIVTIGGNDYISGPSTLDVSTWVEGGGTIIGDIIDVTPAYHWLNWVEVGDEVERTFTLRNMGYDPVTWSVEIVSGPCELLFGEGGSYELPPGGVAEIPVRVTPTVEGAFGGEILFSTSLGDIRRSFAGNGKAPGEDVSITLPTVRISEIQSVNPSGPVLDEDDNPQPWIELHNYGDSPVAITGWALSDDPAMPYKWTFPEEGVTLAADEYLLVFASALNRRPIGGTPALHTNFELNSDGGAVILLVLSPTTPAKSFLGGFSAGAIGHAISYIAYPALAANTSFAYFGSPTVAVGSLGFGITIPNEPSPGEPAPASAMEGKTWYIKPYRMAALTDLPDSVIPSPGTGDNLMSARVVALWAKESEDALVTNDSFSSHSDVECDVKVRVIKDSETNSELVTRVLSAEDSLFLKDIDFEATVRLLVDLNRNHKAPEHYSQPEVVYTVVVLDIVNDRLVTLGVQGLTLVSPAYNGIALSPTKVGGEPKVNFQNFNVLGHELGHYAGIAGHADGYEKPYRLMAGPPADIQAWEAETGHEWIVQLTNTKGIVTEEESKYFKGIWERQYFYSQHWPESLSNEHFSPLEWGEEVWNRYLNYSLYLPSH